MKQTKLSIFLMLPLSIALIVFSCFSLQAQTPKLSDAEIAHVGVTANQIDIDYAAIAQKRSRNEEVKNFAATMAADHSRVIEQAVALVTKLKVTPADNAISKSLLSEAEKKKAELKKLKGKEFDKAYIDNEVEYHKSVISALETILIPQSKNQELKSFLEAILPALRMHLQHAEMVQMKLK